MKASISCVIIFLILIIFSCTKEFNNPYDRACPSILWTPTNLIAVLNQATITISWEENETHFDGFVLEKSADSINWSSVTSGLIDKTVRTYIDSTSNSRPNVFYRIYAKADLNISGHTYSKDLKLPISLPTITTTSFTSITSTSVSCGGIVTSDGRSNIITRGVCWSTVPNPTISDSLTINGTGIGIFMCTITGLNPNVTYFIRAYATNIVGTSYGNTIILSLQYPVYFSTTGHYYRFVARPNISWTDARDEAMSDSMKYNGLRGYLATITSSEENTFVNEITKGTAWIGATDIAQNGYWRWVTGPEGLEDGGKGLLFWKGTGFQAKSDPAEYGSVNGAFQNWNYWNSPFSASLDPRMWEPNDTGGVEFYAHITFFPSDPADSYYWNDLPNSGATGDYISAGYIIEYGGL